MAKVRWTGRGVGVNPKTILVDGDPRGAALLGADGRYHVTIDEEPLGPSWGFRRLSKGVVPAVRRWLEQQPRAAAPR